MQDFALDVEELCHRLETLRFRGCKGTTGTQASFLELFGGDHDKVRELERRVTAKLGFRRPFAVTGQTYPRKADSMVLDALSGIAQSAAKMAGDLRLLQHEGELLEPFESEQIGSSAMAYKRNPMRAERIAGLARFVISLQANGAHTAASQWLERTLDDSANRRLTLPEAFLAHRRDPGARDQHRGGPRGAGGRDPPARGRADAVHGHRAVAHARRGGRRRPPGAARGHPPAQPRRGRGGEPGRAQRPARAAGRRSGVPRRAGRRASRRARSGSYTGRAAAQVGEFIEEYLHPLLDAGSAARGRGRRRRGSGMTRSCAESQLPLPLLRRGKVREVYEVDADHLLLVASDRVSAFDVVMREPIPRKGAVLTQISAFWFERLAERLPLAFHHARTARDRRQVPALAGMRGEIAGRAMLVRRTEPVPFECVVRGYLSGSAWAEYRKPRHARRRAAPARAPARATGSSPRSSRPPPRRRRATTRTSRSTQWPRRSVRDARRPRSRDASFALYQAGRDHAATRGIIIADTKFEFGTDADGTLRLIDEVLTPDSSRFWPADRYQPGRAQPSFDKQPLRDYLSAFEAHGTLERRGTAAVAAARGGRGDEPPIPRGLSPSHGPRPGSRIVISTAPEGRWFIIGAWVIVVWPCRRGRALGCGRGGGSSPRSGPCSRSGSSPSSAIRSGPGLGATDLIIAPADGKVVSVIEIDEPAFLCDRAVRVSIFMNVFDCHVNRYPVDGTVSYRHYNPGEFGHAGAEKASLENEQSSVGLVTSHGRILIRQIAGLVARRIVTDHQAGTTVRQGERMGMIRFGSRVDLFLPLGTRVMVAPGATTRVGVTVVAQWS